MTEKELAAFRAVMDRIVQEYLDNHDIEFDPDVALKNFIDWLDTRRINDDVEK